MAPMKRTTKRKMTGPQVDRWLSNRTHTEVYDGEVCEVKTCEEKCWCCGCRKKAEFIFWPTGRVICRDCNGI
jgi:hypothetical protein